MSGLENAMTPAAVVAKLNEAGIDVSERTLRERARMLGACRIIGKTMFLMPEDIEKIIEAARPKPKVRQTFTDAETAGSPVSRWTDYDTEELRERLKGNSKKAARSSPKPRPKSKEGR